MELLWQLNVDKGITVLMVTHEPEMAAYARRIVRFKDGLLDTDHPNEPQALRKSRHTETTAVQPTAKGVV